MRKRQPVLNLTNVWNDVIEETDGRFKMVLHGRTKAGVSYTIKFDLGYSELACVSRQGMRALATLRDEVGDKMASVRGIA